IVSVDINNGARDTITAGPGLKVFPRWINTDQVAYQAQDGIRFTTGGSEVRGEFQAPDWSPDHRTMVFHRETDHRGDRDRDFQSWRSQDPQFGLLRVPDA